MIIASFLAMPSWSRALSLDEVRVLAEKGNAPAQFTMGLLYEKGEEGMPKDLVEARKWYEKAAEQGNSRAQDTLGVMYLNGEGGLKKDPAEALKWYRRAAAQDFEGGSHIFPLCIITGLADSNLTRKRRLR
jgi:TPR repeat protein